MKREINPNVKAAMLLARNLARNGVEFIPMPVLNDIDRQKLVEESKTRLGQVYGRSVPE